MVTHIVFWKLHTDDPDAAAAKIKSGLEALVGVVPGLLSAEVGRGLKPDAAYDLCLVSKFSSVEALKAYRTHPAHVRVSDYVHTVIENRAAVDYESDDPVDGEVDPFLL